MAEARRLNWKRFGIMRCDEHPARGQAIGDLDLGSRDTVHGPEPLQVRGGDVRDHAHLRARDARQHRQLTGVVETDLDRGRAMLREQSQERERQPDVVVVIPFGLEHGTER